MHKILKLIVLLSIATIQTTLVFGEEKFCPLGREPMKKDGGTVCGLIISL